MSSKLRSTIALNKPGNADKDVREAVREAIIGLDRGVLRVAEKKDGSWQVNEWLKKAVLLSFRLEGNVVMPVVSRIITTRCHQSSLILQTKIFANGGYRIVPPAAVRRGAYIAADVVCMPALSISVLMWTAAR